VLTSNTATLDQAWARVMERLPDVERHRAFIQMAVISGQYKLAVDRYDTLRTADPEIAPLIDKYKRDIAMQVAARLISTHKQPPAVEVAKQKRVLMVAGWVIFGLLLAMASFGGRAGQLMAAFLAAASLIGAFTWRKSAQRRLGPADPG